MPAKERRLSLGLEAWRFASSLAQYTRPIWVNNFFSLDHPLAFVSTSQKENEERSKQDERCFAISNCGRAPPDEFQWFHEVTVLHAKYFVHICCSLELGDRDRGRGARHSNAPRALPFQKPGAVPFVYAKTWQSAQHFIYSTRFQFLQTALRNCVKH